MARAYTEETRAAVIAALLEGQAISHVAKEYKIPHGTVKSWKRRYATDSPVAPQKRAEIGDLLVEYLAENLKSLKAQAKLFQDHTWLAKQGAAELATLHGVMTDKAVRLIEAFGDAPDATV